MRCINGANARSRSFGKPANEAETACGAEAVRALLTSFCTVVVIVAVMLYISAVSSRWLIRRSLSLEIGLHRRGQTRLQRLLHLVGDIRGEVAGTQRVDAIVDLRKVLLNKALEFIRIGRDRLTSDIFSDEKRRHSPLRVPLWAVALAAAPP